MQWVQCSVNRWEGVAFPRGRSSKAKRARVGGRHDIRFDFVVGGVICMADVHSTTELYCEFRKLHPQRFNARALSTDQQQLHIFIRTTVPVEPIPRSYTVVDFERMQIVCVAVRREHDSASRHMMTHHECECFDSYILEIYP